jgi:hypothetical protein
MNPDSVKCGAFTLRCNKSQGLKNLSNRSPGYRVGQTLGLRNHFVTISRNGNVVAERLFQDLRCAEKEESCHPTRATPDSNLAALEEILASSFTYVQIYTHIGAEADY